MKAITVLVTVYNDYSVLDANEHVINDEDDVSMLHLGTFTDRVKAEARYQSFLDEENVVLSPYADGYDGTSNHPVKRVIYVECELDSDLVLNEVQG